MPRPIDFTIKDCSFDMGGSVSVGAIEITLDFEGDGIEFDLTHVWADGLRADPWLVVAMTHWVAADLASKNSVIRRAYREKADARTEDDDADDLADYQRDFGSAHSSMGEGCVSLYDLIDGDLTSTPVVNDFVPRWDNNHEGFRSIFNAALSGICANPHFFGQTMQQSPEAAVQFANEVVLAAIYGDAYVPPHARAPTLRADEEGR